MKKYFLEPEINTEELFRKRNCEDTDKTDEDCYVFSVELPDNGWDETNKNTESFTSRRDYLDRLKELRDMQKKECYCRNVANFAPSALCCQRKY